MIQQINSTRFQGLQGISLQKPDHREREGVLNANLALRNEKLLPVYYRSRLFVVPLTANPLLAAASPLFSLLERLLITPSLPPINQMRENIEHELAAFHCALSGASYGEEFQSIASYLLCATIDEFLGKNYLRLYGKVAEFKAFIPPSCDGLGPQTRFFDIVKYIKERPHQYLDLIELSYFCLISGFEGEQYGRTDGRQVLDNLIEELYQLIKLYRVNKQQQLFKQPKQVEIKTAKQYKSFIFGISLTIIGLVASYCLSAFLLENQAKTLQFRHLVMKSQDSLHG